MIRLALDKYNLDDIIIWGDRMRTIFDLYRLDKDVESEIYIGIVVGEYFEINSMNTLIIYEDETKDLSKVLIEVDTIKQIKDNEYKIIVK